MTKPLALTGRPAEHDAMKKNYLTTREAAKLLRISVRSAQQWVERGRLVGWKTEGGHRRISFNSVQKLLRQQQPEKEKAAPLSVLIVEDDAALVRLYRLNLSTWPVDIALYVAANGYEGLVMVGEVSPRLLICDLRLPGVNGFQIIRSLCEIPRYRHLEIVVISGLSRPEIDAHGGLPERVRLLGKPIDFAALREIVVGLTAASPT